MFWTELITYVFVETYVLYECADRIRRSMVRHSFN